MFKKTKAFPLNEKWEQKLNIKYDIEIEYYKKFCGLPYKYKVHFTDRSNDFEDITYDNWKCHILKTIEKLSLEELKNYSKFLNQQYRDYETHFTLAQTIFAPLIFYLVTILLSPFVSNLNVFSKDVYNLLLYFLFFCGTVVLFMYLLIKLLSYKKEVIYKYFYQDVKEIVDERIELIKTNGIDK